MPACPPLVCATAPPPPRCSPKVPAGDGLAAGDVRTDVFGERPLLLEQTLLRRRHLDLTLHHQQQLFDVAQVHLRRARCLCEGGRDQRSAGGGGLQLLPTTSQYDRANTLAA